MTRTLLAVLLLLPAAAAAEPSLADAQRQLQALEYRRAIETARIVLERGGNDPAALRQLYALLGQALASDGREAEASSYFRQLLALQPDFRLPEHVSPKIRAPLARVQGDWAGRPGLTVTHAAPRSAPADRPLVIRVRVLEDPLRMARDVRAVCELPGGSRTVVEPVQLGEASLTVSTAGATAGELRCRAELLDTRRNVLLRLGPVSVELLVAGRALDRPTPWYRRWWVWTLVGVAVAGATTAAVVGVTSRESASDLTVGWSVKSLRF